MTRGLAAFLLGLSLAAAAPPAAESEAAFTERLAERFRAAAPGAQVEIVGPLDLAIRSRPGDSQPGRIGLGGIWRICANEPESCEAETSHFVTQALLAATEEEAPPFTAAQLRLAVRSPAYCVSLVEATRDAATPDPLVMRDLPPDLCVVVMVDYAERRRVLTQSDLGPLGLNAEEAWRTAQAQTLAVLPRPDTLPRLQSGQIQALADTDYAPTLLLDMEGWRAVATTQGGLLVAVPSDDVLVVADPRVADLAALRQSIREHFDGAGLGVSPTLYRWTPEGWIAVE